MRNPYIRCIECDGASWQAAADDRLVLSATIIVPSGNSCATVNVRIDKGEAQAWPKDTAAPLEGVDLNRLEFAGDSGDVVLIVGNTR